MGYGKRLEKREKYYKNWVRMRQDRLKEDGRRIKKEVITPYKDSKNKMKE